jgi:peptidoglycan/xylan/chitin deacetylase (PgdA/CDA1 family)
LSSSAPKFTVVICSYTDERWSKLERAMASVEAQSLPPEEVILVIDHNEPLLAHARATFPNARVMPSEGPPGVASARNTGTRHARTELVAYLDDDARADADWLADFAPWYADPRVVGVGGVIDAQFAGATPRWLPRELNWIIGASYADAPTETIAVRNLFGSNMSFRRSAVEDVGGFAPELGRGGAANVCCEETELAIRVGQAQPDRVMLQIPGARVEHAVPPERMTWRYMLSRSWVEGRSKALVARSVGVGAGLSTERSYVARMLPPAVAAGIRDALRGDRGGLLRAAAIVGVLAASAAGYVWASGAVALTFDDGPHPEGTPAVLEALARAGASATFFLVGEQVERNPGLVGEIVAAGHGVAVHAHRHRLPLRLTPRAFLDDLVRAEATVAEAAGRRPVLYRPPYGKFSWTALAAVRRRGLAPLLWSRTGGDWTRRASVESIAAGVTRDVRAGDVLLLHDADTYGRAGSHRRTAAALPRVLEELERRGLDTVAL